MASFLVWAGMYLYRPRSSAGHSGSPGSAARARQPPLVDRVLLAIAAASGGSLRPFDRLSVDHTNSWHRLDSFWGFPVVLDLQPVGERVCSDLHRGLLCSVRRSGNSLRSSTFPS